MSSYELSQLLVRVTGNACPHAQQCCITCLQAQHHRTLQWSQLMKNHECWCHASQTAQAGDRCLRGHIQEDV